jgi:hypothetical protein
MGGAGSPSAGQVGLRPVLVPDAHPHVGSGGARPLGQDPRHPGQEIVVGKGVPDPLRERGQDLIRRRAPSVDEPVRQALGSPPRRLERQGDDRRRRGGENRVRPTPDERTDPDDDRDVHGGDENGERAEEQGAVHHHVDLEQPVPKDGDADGHRDEPERGDRH